jgi:NitT/TauT family transport system permease protein
VTAKSSTPFPARWFAPFIRREIEKDSSKPLSARRLPLQRIWPSWAIIGAQLGIFVLLILFWEIAARAGIINPFFWSQPSAIWKVMLIYFTEGSALYDISYTFRSTLLGFMLGTVLGSGLGLSFWWSRNYALVVRPYVICLESIPKLALAPLIILVFGMDLASKVAIATALTLVVSTLTTSAGVQEVDSDEERLFYSLGASRTQVFLKLVIPASLPWIISVLRINIGLALTGSIVGEFIAAQYGLGKTIIYAGHTYEIGLVWVAILVLCVLAMMMYALVSWLEAYLLKGLKR